ncbi:GumC family protein [Candidatus Electronema sp. PJ]|uniref:GumC family protein n=1 Tax=Candidatus Electronema sp. PJ TaxID=3401572 RepID=UPI003AA7C557
MYPEEKSQSFPADLQPEKIKHLREYLRLAFKRKGLLLTVVSITVLISLLSVFSQTPVYTASTKLLVEKNTDISQIEGFNGYMMWDPDFQATQLELLSSFNVALRVVRNLDLDSKYKEHFLRQQRSAPALLDRLRNAVFSFLTKTFAAFEEVISPYLSAEKTLQPLPAVAQAGKGPAAPKKEVEQIAAMIQGAIRVEPIRDTKIVNLFYTHRNPEMAQLITDGLVQAYIDETLDIKTSTARHTLQWMTAKASEEQKKLEASEKALQEYMRQHDIVTVENRLVVLPERLSGLSKELSEAQTKEKEYEAVYRQIETTGKNYTALEAIPLFASNAVLQNIRAQLLTAEQNVRELARKYGEKHPVMKQAMGEQRVLHNELRTEMDRIAASINSSYELAQIKVLDITAMMEETKAELMQMNEHFVQYNILNRAKEMNRTVFDALSSSIKKTDVTAQSMDVKIWPIKKAELPSSPSEPNKKRALLAGLLAGLLGGLGLVFFLEYLDNTAGSGQEIEDRYGLTVLGSVEDLSSRKHNIETFVRDNPLSPTAESYRLIRSGLLLSTPEKPPQVMLITSMVQQEGKTTTVKNLAHILVQNEKKVLIIDCDMRRPRQHSMFGLVNTYGLSSYLSGNVDAQQSLIRQVPDSQVFLITSGPVPPNPAELLSSGKMTQLLQETRASFDFILLDSPPVQQVTDSLALGPLADGTVLVVRAGKTTYEMLDSGIKRLREGHSHLLGIVLNRLKKKHADKGYYGYYSYSSHYGSYSSKGERKKKETKQEES